MTTVQKGLIGTQDIAWDDGTGNTFTRKTSTGRSIVLDRMPGVPLSSFGSLALAVEKIGTNSATLFLNRDDSSTATVPANIAVVPVIGKIMSGTVTWNGPIVGDPKFQWLSGTGHTIGLGATSIARPKWWLTNTTPGTTDMQTAMQYCVNAVGNKATILIDELMLIGDEINLISGGGTIKGSTSNSYFAGSSRNRFHIKNGIGDDTAKTLFWASTSINKGTWTIEDLNIDMNGSTSTGIQNEADANGSARFNIRHINLYNCGKHGILINVGGNTSRIEASYVSGPSGFLVAGEFVTAAFVTGSIGIYLGSSDTVAIGNEVLGGFWYGLQVTATQAEAVSN